MAKPPIKLWLIALIIILTVIISLHHGFRTMNQTKLPTSPSHIPAQTDPYEYNWSLRADSTILARHAGRKKDGEIYLRVEYVQSRHNEDMYTEFYDSDGKVVRKLISHSMGGDRSDFDRWQLPASMYITYYSWAENQFYQLEADLPRDKIKKAFDEITLDYDTYRIDPTYGNEIYLSVGPEGRVAVFVTNASRTSKRLIARYQAKKISGDLVLDVQDDNGDSIFALDENGNYNPKFTREYFSDGYWEEVRQLAPPYYEMIKAGKGMPKGAGQWIDDIQIKYPWKLELVDPTGDWLGEYAVNYIDGEYDVVLRDRLPEQIHALKPVPSNIRTWVYDKPTGQRYYIEIDTYARIPDSWTRNGLNTLYKDPNVEYLRKRFKYFYPKNSLATNDTPVKPEEFATLKIILDGNGKMSEIYLEKNGIKLPLDGAYHYYLAPVKEDGYMPQEGFDKYITKPKIDLSNPELTSME